MSKNAPIFQIESRQWIVPSLLPLGGIVLVAADTNIGKSPLAYHILSCVTALKDFSRDLPVAITEPMNAFLFNGEGEMKKDVNPRLIAAGVDIERVTRLDCVVDHPELTLSDIPDMVRERPDVGFVVLDPLTALCNTSTNSAYQLRQLLAPFFKLASERNVTFLFNHHTIKSRTARTPIGLISGSKGLTDNIPTVLQLESLNPNGEAILEITKGRGIARPFPHLEFWIEATSVEGLHDPIPFAVVGGPSAITVAELMVMRCPNVNLSAPAKALDWLRVYLSDGPRLVTDIEADGKKSTTVCRPCAAQRRQAASLTGSVWATVGPNGTCSRRMIKLIKMRRS